MASGSVGSVVMVVPLSSMWEGRGRRSESGASGRVELHREAMLHEQSPLEGPGCCPIASGLGRGDFLVDGGRLNGDASALVQLCERRLGGLHCGALGHCCRNDAVVVGRSAEPGELRTLDLEALAERR